MTSQWWGLPLLMPKSEYSSKFYQCHSCWWLDFLRRQIIMQGLYSLSGWTSYHKTSWSLDFSNCSEIWQAPRPICLSTSRQLPVLSQFWKITEKRKYLWRDSAREKLRELYLYFSMLGDSTMLVTTLYLLDPPLCWNATLIGIYNGVGFMIKVSAAQWWCDDIETISALLAFCSGNPLVTGSFPHKGASKAELWFSKILDQQLSWWWFVHVMPM